MNVYVKGVLSISGKEGALENIRALTDRFENQDSESAYNKIPESYIQQLINEITGINITVQSIEGVFKLSQDKTLTTRKQIIEDLKKRNTAFDLMLAQYIEAN
jgi:predicted FMN-binding regulatory protein PaiB